MDNTNLRYKINNNKIINIYENDLRYKNYNNIDLKNIENLNLTEDFDTIEYRLKEEVSKNNNFLDLSHLDLHKMNIIMPQNIIYLFLNNNQLTSLNFINEMENLKVLDISFNSIEKLERLPYNIEELICKNNKLEFLDFNLHKKLVKVDCSNNNIKEIRNAKNVEILICHHNELDNLDQLEKIKKLECSFNKIKKLNELNFIELLDCSYNRIFEIKSMPKLRFLYCNHNELKNLNNAMQNIEIIECCGNQITNIIFYDKLRELLCDYNQNIRISKNYHEKLIDSMIQKHKKVIIFIFE